MRALSSTFHRFVDTVARSGVFGRVRYLAPVRRADERRVQEVLERLDQSVLELVPTTYFSGIADYLLRSAYLMARNWRPIDSTIADSDLLWLRLPASNAPLALSAARRHRVAHFGWVAGSATDVVRAQRRAAPGRWAAHAAAAA